MILLNETLWKETKNWLEREKEIIACFQEITKFQKKGKAFHQSKLRKWKHESP